METLRGVTNKATRESWASERLKRWDLAGKSLMDFGGDFSVFVRLLKNG